MINDLLVPKSKDNIIKQLNCLSIEEKNKRLIKAAEKGRLDIIKLLIEYEVDINVKDENGDSILMIASLYNHLEIAELLIKMGANVNIKDGDAALMKATRNNRLYLVNLLIKAGAYINIKNKNSFTALLLAKAYYYKNIIDLLIKNGAK
jgi:ankyrin repeat protein